METIQTEQVKARWYRRKVFAIPIAIALMAVIVAAAVVFSSSAGTITINEALNQTAATFAVSGFPGEIIQKNFTVSNSANVALPLNVAWTQDTNANNVSYTTNMPFNQTMQPGNNTVSVTYTIASGSPVGSFNGTVAFTRN